MTEIVPYKDSVLTSYEDIERAAKAMAGSGFFADTRQASQAIVKILAAREIGLGPFSGMTGINIIQGKPAFGANILAACVKRSGRYNYVVHEMSDTRCSIIFKEFLEGKWQVIGTSTFTLDDAKKAGTKNLDKFPRNMLFARAMSNGVRWFTPDVMNGTTVYTPEELGADTDEDGNVVNGTVAEIQPAPDGPTQPLPPTEPETEPTPSPAIPSTKPEPVSLEEAYKIKNRDGLEYGNIPSETLQVMLLGIRKALNNPDVSADDRTEYLKKQSAINLIIAARKSGEV